MNSHGVARVTYLLNGNPRQVLCWGAVDWAEKFQRDYSGGWKSKVADARHFSNNCRPYTGSTLPFMIVACDAPDGSHWALQQWSRLWKNYGGDSAPAELYISHWRGGTGKLAIATDYSYHGEHQHLWGNFTFHGKPVFGTDWTPQGVPTDNAGRNVYVDRPRSHATGAGAFRTAWPVRDRQRRRGERRAEELLGGDSRCRID